jgi:O-antigen ligase
MTHKTDKLTRLANGNESDTMRINPARDKTVRLTAYDTVAVGRSPPCRRRLNSTGERTGRLPAPQRWLLRFVDCGLCGVVFVVPLLMGGRSALGQLVLAALAAVVACAWFLRQGIRGERTRVPVGPGIILSAAVAITALQFVPLPSSALSVISPNLADVLPLWQSSSDSPSPLGSWSTISLSPSATRTCLAVLLAYSLLFLVTIQRIGGVNDVQRILRWCALSAIFMAIFGLVQLLAGNGKFFWFLELPFTSTFDVAKGSFTNRNHFAHFLALGAGPLIWWLQDSYGGAKSWQTHSADCRSRRAGAAHWMPNILMPALGILLLAGLLSLSRGGMLMLFVAAGICAAVCLRQSALGKRFALALAVAGVLTGGALAVSGYQRVSDRLAQLSSGSAEIVDQYGGRREIWTATARAMPHFAICGSGAGSFRDVYPTFFSSPVSEAIEYTHAENCYLQIALEAGFPGLVLALGGVGGCIYWCMGSLKRSAPVEIKLCAGAIAGSLAASILHAAADFVWYVPACMAIVAILAACALRLSQLAGKERASTSISTKPLGGRRRMCFSPAFAVAALLLGAWMVNQCAGPAMAEPYWNEYQLAKIAFDRDANQVYISVLKEQSGNPARLKEQQRLIDLLSQVARLDAGNARAHLDAAEAYLRLFDARQAASDNRMSLGNIRDAAIASAFSTRAELDGWLSRAVGDHREYLDLSLRHAREALEISPLHASAYLYLANLCFLDGGDAARKESYIEQALRARPFDGDILYAAAQEAWLAGDSQQWLDRATRSFQSGPTGQKRFIDNLVARTAPEGIEQMIDFIVRQFQPDATGLRYLLEACSRRAGSEQLLALRRYYAQCAEEEAPTLPRGRAAAVWLEAARQYAILRDSAKAAQCAQGSLAADQNSYDAHYILALSLIEEKSYEEAQEQLHWCLQRKSGDAELQKQYKLALQGKLDANHAAARDGPGPMR